MSRAEEFERYWVNHLQGCDLKTIEKATEFEQQFVNGYYNAVKDLPTILANARQQTHDDCYPVLNNFIDSITEIMYNEIKEGMEANLDNYTDSLIENYKS